MNHMGEHCPNPELLARWLEQTLGASERAQVLSHLAGCDDCRRAITLSSAIGAPPAGEVNEVLLQRVINASRRRRSIRPWLSAAAAALMAVGLLVWLKRPASQEPDLSLHPPQPTTPAPVVPGRPVTPEPFVPPHPEPVKPVPPEKVESEPEKKTPDPVPPETPKEEPKKTVVAAEDPKPTPGTTKEDPAAVVKKLPGTTEPDLSGAFASLFMVDPSGDLWINRNGGEPLRAGRYEQVGYRDTLSAHDTAGAFALGGKATLALERGASATVAWKKAELAYALTLTQGTVMVDTEGEAQKWQVARGTTEVTFSNLNGRFVIEPRGEQLATVLLTGRCDLKIGTSNARRLDAGRDGRELLIAGDGKVAEKAADAKKYARLAQLRPKDLTVFAATFEEKDEIRPFPYTVPTGKLVQESFGTYLHADVPTSFYPKAGEKVFASGGVKAERPIVSASNMVFRFRYRTNLPTFTVRLGNYSAVYTSRLKAGQWGDGEIALEAFESEGVTLLPKVELTDILFQAPVDGKKVGTLDVDGLQFLRLAR
jgi:putative zinc finger protein